MGEKPYVQKIKFFSSAKVGRLLIPAIKSNFIRNQASAGFQDCSATLRMTNLSRNEMATN